ncbi:MAG: DUF1059 domain-containing protein [Deltaproteobacteria bacterium]|nr:MAG: DUF1059 domain-containing protein [Deltaproteobacteria bacterium]
MDKRLSCKDLNIDCEFNVCARTETEVLAKAEEHIQAVHRMKGFSKECYEKVQAAIRDGYCDLETKDALSEGICYTEACLCA